MQLQLMQFVKLCFNTTAHRDNFRFIHIQHIHYIHFSLKAHTEFKSPSSKSKNYS